MSDEELSEPVEIPMAELSRDALRGVIEAFVLREGTDYGPAEYDLDSKVEAVMAQLARREARIMFDPATESVGIVPV
ncbi:MAG: YheU family protein [Pseudomonadota bacterium]